MKLLCSLIFLMVSILGNSRANATPQHTLLTLNAKEIHHQNARLHLGQARDVCTVKDVDAEDASTTFPAGQPIQVRQLQTFSLSFDSKLSVNDTERIEGTKVYYFKPDKDGVEHTASIFYPDYKKYPEARKNGVFYLLTLVDRLEFQAQKRDKKLSVSIGKPVAVSEFTRHNRNCPAGIRPIPTKFFDIDFETEPEGAEIWVDGEKLGFSTNLTLRIPESHKGKVVKLVKQGYYPFVFKISEDSSRAINLIKKEE